MSGYKHKSVKNHPLFPGRQTAEMHRVVMAEKLGRSLESDEWVHHKDEDKTNFKEDNLEVMTPKAHAQLHLGGKKRPGVAAKLKGRKHSKAAIKKMVEAALANREARSRAGKIGGRNRWRKKK